MGKRGPKEKQLDRKQVERAFSGLATMEEAAYKLNVCRNTLTKWIESNTEFETAAEFKAKYRAEVAIALKSKAVSLALKGDTKMLSIMLKNVCGYTDKVEQTNKGQMTVSIEPDVANKEK